jgi:hypothetical protein
MNTRKAYRNPDIRSAKRWVLAKRLLGRYVFLERGSPKAQEMLYFSCKALFRRCARALDSALFISETWRP